MKNYSEAQKEKKHECPKSPAEHKLRSLSGPLSWFMEVEILLLDFHGIES
jgi:hypothetical protein